MKEEGEYPLNAHRVNKSPAYHSRCAGFLRFFLHVRFGTRVCQIFKLIDHYSDRSISVSSAILVVLNFAR